MTEKVHSVQDSIRALGRQIAAERVAAGLKQEELAERIGSHVNTLRRYELGQRDIPFGVTEAIAKALGMRTSHLVAAAEERAARDAG